MQTTILLVEDDPTLLDLNRRVLEQNGCRVLLARDIREAREHIARAGPHAAVLDVELPGGSGLDLCRELREMTDIPIVFLTSRAGADDQQAGYDAGADDYITKPYRIDRLTESLDTLLKRNCPK